jgi:hypothetical protein
VKGPQLQEQQIEQTAPTPDGNPQTIGARLDGLRAQPGKHPLLAVGLGIVIGYLLARAINR